MNLRTFFHSLFLLLAVAACTSQADNKKGDENKVIHQAEPERKTQEKVILFFGNSLTAGYGVLPEESFPSRIAQRIDSLGLPYQVVNSGVSGETTSGGLGRIDWVLSRQPVDVFVLELGANDGLRGIPPEETEKNLKAIIDKVREANPDVKIILAGMMVPPNMGARYSKTYEKVFPAVAEDKDVALVPFLLEGVGGVADMNQEDGIHPNPKGAKILAENVWVVLEDLLERE